MKKNANPHNNSGEAGWEGSYQEQEQYSHAGDPAYQDDVAAQIAWYKGRKKKRRRITLGMLLLLAMAGFLAYSIYVRPPSQNPGDGLDTPSAAVSPPVQNTPAAPGESQAPETPEPTTGHKSYCYTFLVVGVDYMSSSTDTMMVGMLDTKNNKLNVISIPRDTLANVSGQVKKINTAYGNGGIEGLMSAVRQLVGFSIDHYIAIGVEGFVQLVDSVDGIYYDVPMDMYHADETQIIDIKKGYQRLNGYDALGVVRFREPNLADIGRISRQQDFLKTAASQLLTVGNVTKIREWAEIFERNVNTSLDFRNLLWYGEQFLKLSNEDIIFGQIPIEGIQIRGGWYVNIVLDDWLEMINEMINPYYEQVRAGNLDVLIWDEQKLEAVSTRGETIPYTKFYPFPNSTY